MVMDPGRGKEGMLGDRLGGFSSVDKKWVFVVFLLCFSRKSRLLADGLCR